MSDYQYKKGDRVEYLRQISPDVWHPATVFSVWKLRGEWFATLKTDSGWMTEHSFKNIRISLESVAA